MGVKVDLPASVLDEAGKQLSEQVRALTRERDRLQKRIDDMEARDVHAKAILKVFSETRDLMAEKFDLHKDAWDD